MGMEHNRIEIISIKINLIKNTTMQHKILAILIFKLDFLQRVTIWKWNITKQNRMV